MAVEVREREIIPDEVEATLEAVSAIPAVTPYFGVFSSIVYDEPPDFLDQLEIPERNLTPELQDPLFDLSRLHPQIDELEVVKKLHRDGIKAYDPLRLSTAITAMNNSLRRIKEFAHNAIVGGVQRVLIQEQTELPPLKFPPIDENPQTGG